MKKTSPASRRGRQARRVGQAWERKCCQLISKHLGIDAKRNLEEVRSGNCGDIMTSAPFAVQCKTGQRPPVFKAVREAQAAAVPEELAVAMIHRNRRPGEATSTEIVAMPLEDWLTLAAMAMGLRKLWQI